MKQNIIIKYSSIFKYQDDKEVVKYHEIGTLIEENNHKIINFSNNNINIQLDMTPDTLILEYNKSILKLKRDEIVLNDYHTDYGVIKLKTKLILFEYNNNVKIKYQLLDSDQLICEIYILINIDILEN